MKNFLKGYGSVLDLFPGEKYPSVDLKKLKLPKDSTEAIQRDWEAVGKAIWKSMLVVEKAEDDALGANIELANRKANERLRGQCFGFVITLLCVAGGFYLALKGKTITGTFFQELV